MALINFKKLFRHNDTVLDKELDNIYTILNKHLHTFILDIGQIPKGINGFPDIKDKTTDRLFNTIYENEQDAGQLLLVVLKVLFSNNSFTPGGPSSGTVEGFFGYKTADISLCKEHSHVVPHDERTLYLVIPARYKYKFETTTLLGGTVQIIKWTEIRFIY